jgi:hypothetical protein
MLRTVPLILAASLVWATPAVAQYESKTYEETHGLLAQMDDSRFSSPLSNLFRIGDERVNDLIRALDDKQENVSLNAQRVIRYLGNPIGMKALFAWYEKREKETGTWIFIGAVPLPLTDWDFEFIKKSNGIQPEFAYALVLDNSLRAKATRAEALAKPSGMTDSCTGPRFDGVRKYDPTDSFPDTSDIAKQVAAHAFFICPFDKQYTSAKLEAYNGKKDKALIYLKIDRGPLAEEWYQIVIQRTPTAWRFFSITQTAVS